MRVSLLYKMWFIKKINRLYFPEKHILPCGEFILHDENDMERSCKGWLPCHHTNVGYDLEIKGSRIFRVIDLYLDKTKKKQKTKFISQMARRLKSVNGFENYKDMAMKAVHYVALWTCCTLYSHWELRKMNIEHIFNLLVKDIESLIEPDSEASRTKFLFQPLQQTKILIQRALRQMGELPYKDWAGFEERRKWHIRMHADTGSVKKPGPHIRRLERYKNLWTTTYLIEEARSLNEHFRPDNVTLIEGSPCQNIIPNNAGIVVRTLEDAYKWKCEVTNTNIYILELAFNRDRLIELGVGDIAVLPKGLCLYMPWAHTWSQGEFIKLAEFEPQHVTTSDQAAKKLARHAVLKF